METSGILIAGPARCGKSTVSGIMREGNVDYAVLTVDALFPAFINEKLNTREESVKFIREYLLRPRYMNPEKTSVRCPADDMGDFFEPIIAALSDNIHFSSSTTDLISDSFDQWVLESGKEAWLAPDLHAELYFQKLISHSPNLQMIVLLRDPREAIAASLYWRTYPERMLGGWKIFVYKLFLWCLSAETGRRLVQQYPENVRVLFIDGYTNGSSDYHSDSLSDLMNSDLESFNNKAMYFSYEYKQGWLGPDGRRSKLLSDNEKKLIETVSQPWMNQQLPKDDMIGATIYMGVIGIRLTLSIAFMISRVINPGFGKAFIDWMIFPVANSRRTIFNVARIILGRQ